MPAAVYPLFTGSPERLMVAWFLGLILLGTPVLMLPGFHKAGQVGFLEALFSATSAVCVTGLIVVDTATDFTLAGQCVLLVLLQLGGLGVMTFAAIAFRILGQQLPLSSQAAVREAFVQDDLLGEFRHWFWQIVRIAFIIEALGAAALFFGQLGSVPPLHAAYSALFHSLSAFCNAGFSIYSDSLIGWNDNAWLLLVVMLLIVLGGLGHTVLLELYAALVRLVKRQPLERPPAFSVHARLVFWVSGVLIVLGALFFVFAGIDPHVTGDRFFSGAFFQSVTARTAGFNSAPLTITRIPLPTLLVLTGLMLIGGSPGSCAGGVKTTTLAIWLARIRSSLWAGGEVTLLGRHIPEPLVRRAVVVMSVAAVWNVAGVILLSLTEAGAAFGEILFEQISAFATVGLSVGLTPHLSTAGRLWIILTMFVGRLGPLTIALSLRAQQREVVRAPLGRVRIG